MSDPLRRLLSASGLSMAQLGRLVLAGRDPRLVRRWMAGEPVPEGTAVWAETVRAVEVTTHPDGSARVVLSYRPGTVTPRGRPSTASRSARRPL